MFLAVSGWARHGDTHARGQAYDASGTLLRAVEIAQLFDSLGGPDEWVRRSAELNGCFAAVQTGPAGTRATVDRLRSIPLFFARVDDAWVVADNADALEAILPRCRLDEECASEFRLTGYVTGDQTLIDGLRTIRAGHCLFVAPGSTGAPELRRHYAFRHTPDSSRSDDDFISELVGTHERVFRRLIDDLNGRPIAIPLSGGYDSRLIGVMLRDLGYRDVLCYSYGRERNWESAISRELAQYLGFRWTMVVYSPTKWQRWAAMPAFQRYFASAGNFSAVPHFQDWPAVAELRERGDLPNEAVFVPGHSGDFLAGSHVPKWYVTRQQIGRDEILQSLFDSHYSLWDWPRRGRQNLFETFNRRVERVTGPLAAADPEAAADVFERWDCEERQAKFIVNSVRVYEAFGHEWRLPLFDSELMDFWTRVPVDRRVERRLYFRFVDRHQRLPITRANRDHTAPIEHLIRWINRGGLRPAAKRAQYAWRRANWRKQYERGDLAWFSLVDPGEFRTLYTGREIGHSFFARRYLNAVASRCNMPD